MNEDLLKEIRLIRETVENLEKKIDNTNNVLVTHISFINRVFDTIKQPLFYVMNKVNSLLLLENNNLIH